MKFHTLLKTHFDHARTTSFLCESVPVTISRFCSFFLVPLFTSLLKFFGFIPKFFNRSKEGHVIEESGSNFSENHSEKDYRFVTDNSTSEGVSSSGFAEQEDLALQKRDDSIETVAETEDSVFLIANSSKYEFMSGKNIIHYVENPKELGFKVKEMFVGSNEDLGICEQNLDSEISLLEKNLEESDKESGPPSFHFKLFDSSCFRNEDTQVHNESLLCNPSIIAWNWDSLSLCNEIHEDNKNLNSSNSEEIRDEVKDSSEDESMEDQDFSYEVELLSPGRYLEPDSNQDILITKKESIDQEFVDRIDFPKLNSKSEAEVTIGEKIEDLDEEYIELGPSKVRFPGIGAESFRNYMENEESTDTEDDLQEKDEYLDSDSDDEDESDDVLREHENLVQQIKMELKNCRIGGMPTISEEFECPKMVEDLKPLNIDHKFDYKDLMAEIQKFYKSYVEKMRKLDVLNYQTLHAINFLQLKESEVFKPGKKNSGSAHFNMSKIWKYKVQKIYADPMHKSIKEMQNDLELVYVGQLCLSWEILCWLYIKGQDLIKYDSNGNHSYNNVTGEFQQFQVLLQRFMEDEPFQRPRIQNYVRNRCMIRSLLQVPTIKGDCLKDMKERREEKDAISLTSLLEIIKESMLIVRDFLRADKAALNVIIKGVQGTKVVCQDTTNSELLGEIITNLQKKDRRIKENMRSQNCIVKKLQKHQDWQLDDELFASQVELRMVSRVLSLSRLTTDQLVWCQNKLSNISFVRRRVHLEPSFLLFPC